MIIGVDCDGVLADFNRDFIARVLQVTGRDLFGAGYEPTTWNYPQALGYTDAEIEATWAAIHRDACFWVGLAPYSTAPNDLRTLAAWQATGEDLYFVTHRIGRWAKRQTETWLRGGGVPSPTVLLTPHKGLVARALAFDCYIDDRLENCLDVAASGQTRTYLMNRPWNRDADAQALGLTRVASVSGMLARESSNA